MNKFDVKTLRDNIKEPVLETFKSALTLYPDLPKNVIIISTVNDEASKIYMNNKKKSLEECGLHVSIYSFDNPEITYFMTKIIELVEAKDTLGIIIQKPLTDSLKMYEDEIDSLIPRSKDIDQVSFNKDGRYFSYIKKSNFSKELMPCTVLGVVEIIFKYYNLLLNDSLKGKRVLIIGRSKIVGKPLFEALLERDATVTIAHSKTDKETLKDLIDKSEVVVSAVGKPKIWNKEFFERSCSKLLIDVGINRLKDGKICGDFDIESLKEFDYTYTPVPGGVGLMTVLGVLINTLHLINMNI